MYYPKAAFFAVAGLLASSGIALADNAPKTSLSLDPTVITADAAADRAPLMMALDKVGGAKPLDDLGLNIYGWVEAGYTYNHRHHGGEGPIAPGPFNHEVGNHFMLNQVDVRFERTVATDKFDVGGLVEVMYGTDANAIHSTGWGFNGDDATTDSTPEANDDRYHPMYQFDVAQAYLTVNVPVGNGLKLTVGKFVTLIGYETVDPRQNAFYSHSWIFGAMPFSQTGVLGTYTFNDQLTATAGITRGWDITMEDNNGCAIDAIGNFVWTPNKQLNFTLVWNVGPENAGDTSHYRTVIDPIVTWQVTDQLKLAFEGLYVYDGGLNQPGPLGSHAYGDVWGGAFYASYMINDMVTANLRLEKYHSYAASFGSLAGLTDTPTTLNVYSITLGTTITPMPKDSLLKNFSVRPEVRYDFSEDHVFSQHGASFKDQLTFAADVIFKF